MIVGARPLLFCHGPVFRCWVLTLEVAGQGDCKGCVLTRLHLLEPEMNLTDWPVDYLFKSLCIQQGRRRPVSKGIGYKWQSLSPVWRRPARLNCEPFTHLNCRRVRVCMR